MTHPNKKLKCREEKLQIIKDVPQKDIALTLELEMDDEVKEIISCPEKYADTMLDVTVIKPKLDKLYTAQKKIMTGEEVKKFIAAMSSAKSEVQPQVPKQNLSNTLGDHINKCPEIQKNPMAKFAPPPDFRVDRTEGSTSENDRDHVKQIYTTPKTFTELSSLFECKNRNRRGLNEKPDTPCLCKNCSIVGVVTDSQKKPFANESTYDPSEMFSSKKENKESSNRKKKTVNYKEEIHHDQCHYYFTHLSEKIRVLEARVAAQEERSVAKDYFKKIIMKVMNHISKVTNYASQIRMETVLPNNVKRPKESPREKYNRYTQKFIVSPLSVNKEKSSSDKEGPASSSTTFWKWGEDVLKPGIDLKNRIIELMEETLNNLKKTKEKSKDEEIKHFVNEFSANLHKTLNEDCSNGPSQKNTKTEPNAIIDFRDKENAKLKSLARTSRRPKDEPVSVTYINSKILKWKETETTFKFDSDMESINDQKKVQEVYKLEFMKTLKNTKDEDKVKLWCSIWNQAVKNRQEKHDKVTIQIPDRRDKTKQVEIIYTLGDLEYLLLGQKSRNR